jgi:hypothetical protein
MALCAAPAVAQMPDPARMSGQILPAGDLPTGTVTVRIIRQTMANAVSGVTVELHGAGEVRRAATAAQGRAQFDGLPVGARVHVVAIVDGERLESVEFAVPASGGARTLLAAGVGAGTSPGNGVPPSAPSTAPVPNASGNAGQSELVLGADTRFAIEFQDDQLTVFYLLELLNRSASPVAAAPVVIELPSDASGASLMQGAPSQATVSGTRVSIAGPFPPGVTQVPIAFRVERWPADWSLEQRFPLRLENVAIAAQKLSGMTLGSPQATTVRETSFQGTPYIVAIGNGLAAGTPLTVTLRGLPHRSAVPLYLTLAVAVGLIAWGVWAAGTALRSSDDSRRRQLEARRLRGLSALAALDAQGRGGSIDAPSYRDKRAILLRDLERIYRELDALGTLPGGDQGLAA